MSGESLEFRICDIRFLSRFWIVISGESGFVISGDSAYSGFVISGNLIASPGFGNPD